MAAAEWHIRGEMDAAKGADNSFVMYGVTDGQIVAGYYRECSQRNASFEKNDQQKYGV